MPLHQIHRNHLIRRDRSKPTKGDRVTSLLNDNMHDVHRKFRCKRTGGIPILRLSSTNAVIPEQQYQRRVQQPFHTFEEAMDDNDLHFQNRVYHRRGQTEFKLKMDIPHFNGSMHIEDFIDWMTEVGRFFDYMNIEEERKVKLVVLRFKGVASAWWEQTVKNRARSKCPTRVLFEAGIS